ncbi:hypothetical protein JCM19239_3206 [Vibrio variabilis]|uniref:Uncharacterized protein n=1 Tax=Vibrio variabilis TaxID=990271 RepID=A0ABQ0JIE1_9VIBR|nr:hypothetical protein JCM19239_3206 [Vibrio variabilis]
MNESVKNELGRLLVNQEALLEVLSKSHSSLTEYPELQDYLARKNLMLLSTIERYAKDSSRDRSFLMK